MIAKFWWGWLSTPFAPGEFVVYVYDSVSWVLNQRAPVVRHRENGVEKQGNPGSKMPKQSGLGILIWSNLPRCWRGKGRLQCGHSGKKWQKFGWWWREIPCQSQKSSGSQPVLVETGFSGPQKVGVKEDELFIQQWGQSMTAVQPAAMVILFIFFTRQLDVWLAMYVATVTRMLHVWNTHLHLD